MSATADDVAGRVARDLGSIAILMDSERRKAMGAGQHEAAESLAVQANLFAEGERIIRSQAARIEKLEAALRQIENWPMHGNLTDNEDNISAEDMPHYVAGRAYAVISLIQNYARNSIARAALERT